MATIKTGLTPTKLKTGAANSHQLIRHQIANGYATALFIGDPVKVSVGYVQIAANGVNAIGTFAGCEYIDPNSKQYINGKYFPASTSMTTGSLIEDIYNTPLALIAPAEGALFTARSATSVTLGAVGLIYPMVIGTGSTLTGQSAALIDTSAGAVTAGAGMVRIVGLHQTPGSTFGLTTTECVVEFVNVGL